MILHNKDESEFEIVMSNAPILGTHSHAFLEIAYVANGSARHRIGDHETIMSKGNYYIVDYDTEHSYSSISDEPLEIINICFHPKLIDKSLANSKSFNELLRNYLIKIDTHGVKIEPKNALFFDDDGKIYECISALSNEYAKKESGFREIMRSYLVTLIIRTMRKLTIDSTDSAGILGKIYSEVAKSPMAPPTLTEIAEKLGYSPYYLSCRFKLLSGGIGYREYVLKTKMTEAARLLANTDKKIAEIAEAIGYLDTNSFYIAFKKEMGLSPAAYRKSLV